MLLFMALASASDRRVTQEVTAQVTKACRQAKKPAHMADDSEFLRIQAMVLSQTVHDLTSNQLPQLLETVVLVYTEPTEEAEVSAAVGVIIQDLRGAERDLSQSIRRSANTASHLRGPRRPADPRGLARRHQAVQLCTTDRIQLANAMVAVGDLLSAQEPVITSLTADLMLVWAGRNGS